MQPQTQGHWHSKGIECAEWLGMATRNSCFYYTGIQDKIGYSWIGDETMDVNEIKAVDNFRHKNEAQRDNKQHLTDPKFKNDT